MGQYDAQIYNDLINGGLTPTAAAGVMGNMAQESSMNPAVSGGGLMQWIGGRWNALVSYASSHGLSPSSEKAQVGYFFQELNAGNEGITKSGLNSQPTPAAAALYVSTNFERPNPAYANNTNREAQATYFYNEFSGGSVAPGSMDGLITTSSSSAQTTPSAGAFPTGNDVISNIDKALSLQGFDIAHPAQSITQDAGALSLRVVLVLIGLILVIFALVAVVEKAGVNPAQVAAMA